MKPIFCTLLLLLVFSCNNEPEQLLMCTQNEKLFNKVWNRQHPIVDEKWRFAEGNTVSVDSSTINWEYQGEDCKTINLTDPNTLEMYQTIYIDILSEDVLIGKSRIRGGNLFDIEFTAD